MLEDIRVTPEERDATLGEINHPWDAHQKLANTATDKAWNKAIEFVDDWNSMRGETFTAKWGEFADEDGFCISLPQALKKLVEGG